MGSKAPSRVRIPHSPPPCFTRVPRRDAQADRQGSTSLDTPKQRCFSAKSSDFENVRMELTDSFRVGTIPLLHRAPVAQLDRAPGYELGGRRFESFRARQSSRKSQPSQVGFFFVRPRIAGPPQRGGRSPPREAVLREPRGLTLPGAPIFQKSQPSQVGFFFVGPRIAGPSQRGGRSPPRDAVLRELRGLTLPGVPRFKQKADRFAVGLLFFACGMRIAKHACGRCRRHRFSRGTATSRVRRTGHPARATARACLRRRCGPCPSPRCGRP
jgi:hypothetical protein